MSSRRSVIGLWVDVRAYAVNDDRMRTITICTPTCSASQPCPNDKNGNPITCKATPNDCRAQ